MNKGDESDGSVLSSDERSIFINKSAMDKNALKKALASVDDDDDFVEDPLSVISSKKKKKKENKPLPKKLKSSGSFSNSQNDDPNTAPLKRSTSSSRKAKVIVDLDEEDSSESHYVDSATTHVPPTEKVIQSYPKAMQSIVSVRNAQELLKQVKNSKKKQLLRSSVIMEDSPPKSPENEPEENTAIILQLKGKKDEKSCKFRINKDDPLKKLVDYYSKAKNILASSLVMKLDGITLLPTQTPRDLELLEGDLILIESRLSRLDEEILPITTPKQTIEDDDIQITGEKSTPSNSTSNPSLARAKTEVIAASEENENQVKLKVRDKEGEKGEKKYKVAKNESLLKLMEGFCKAKNYAMNKVKFTFDGTVIHPNQTPEDLDLDDEDVIDCVITV